MCGKQIPDVHTSIKLCHKAAFRPQNAILGSNFIALQSEPAAILVEGGAFCNNIHPRERDLAVCSIRVVKKTPPEKSVAW